MREDELRRVVDAVVRVLAEKGFLSASACGCESPKPKASATTKTVSVTTGTAGKVFSDSWRAPQVQKTAPVSPSSVDADDNEHTGGPNCPHCDRASHSQSQLTELGVERIAMCHPTKNC